MAQKNLKHLRAFHFENIYATGYLVPTPKFFLQNSIKRKHVQRNSEKKNLATANAKELIIRILKTLTDGNLNHHSPLEQSNYNNR
jgi:hypothetical protein